MIVQLLRRITLLENPSFITATRSDIAIASV